MNLTQSVIEKLETLPLDKQQEVLDFVEFLQSKATVTNGSEPKTEEISALEAARHVLGIIGDGPSDLSTNKRYMEGYGQ